MELKLVPKEPGSPEEDKPPKEKPKPPKPRSMKEMNAVIDRMLAELKAAADVYKMMNHMLLVLKDEVKSLKEQKSKGIKNEENVLSGTGMALREELEKYSDGSDIEPAQCSS